MRQRSLNQFRVDCSSCLIAYDNALFINDYYDPDLQEELEYYYENSGTEEDVDLYDFVEGENFYETGEWILVPKEQTSA